MDNENLITTFAKTNFRNKEVPFGIKTDDRRRHMYLIGKTGMGKTTLMENMVIQDIKNGHGVAFLDPHGDSVQRILNSIPANRINDVVYFNPADLEYPVAFNILEAVEAKYKHLVASGLMGVFTKIWANLWSARMEYILNNTILALLDSPGNTLLGITRMYVDKKYRKKIVDNIKDPMVKAFWTDEYANYNEKYRTEAIAPIQNKVGQFLSSGIIRNIVGQPKSTIDLRDIMDNNKILIMDLSKGKVGEDNSALLGAMVVTKLQLAALSRADMPEQQRKDFYLYVDEFQNFATDSFATILSEARKYRLNLIVGHQYIGQLIHGQGDTRNTKVKDAILGNVGTLIIFRIGAEDAKVLVKEFEPHYEEVDLVNLPKFHILLKLMINGVASEAFSATTLAPSPDMFTGNSGKVIKVSRERYSTPVAGVEEKIARWMGAEFHHETAVVIGEEEKDGSEREASSVELKPEPKPERQEERPKREEKPRKDENRKGSERPRREENNRRADNQRRPARHDSRRDSGGDDQPRRDNNQRRGDGEGRRRKKKRNKDRGQEQHKKQEHPVWETVANLNGENKKDDSEPVINEVQPKHTLNIGSPETKPQPKQDPQKEPGTSQNSPNSPIITIKPGESHKF